MYVYPNFKTKKAFREAVKEGKYVCLYAPDITDHKLDNGEFVVEGPHYPEPHRWYATCTVKAGRIVRVT